MHADRIHSNDTFHEPHAGEFNEYEYKETQ